MIKTEKSCKRNQKQDGPILYVVATPIGNLEDITLRALKVLESADYIACEDTRRSKILLDFYGIKKKMLSYHEHSSAQEQERIMALLTGGSSIALISDAGTPLISDPGFRLVEACIKSGIKVSPIPGACAFVAALSAAGAATDEVIFIGFLPQQSSKKIAKLEKFQKSDSVIVMYESPNRVIKTLNLILEILGDRNVIIAREMTKLHEEFISGTCTQLIQKFDGHSFLGEIVIIIERSTEQPLKKQDIETVLAGLLQDHSLKDAVQIAAELSGGKKRDIYEAALQISGSIK